MTPYKPILCLDFDGVIHSYTSPWSGVATISDPPVPGAFDWIARAMEHFEVCIYSSRSIEPSGREAMRQWFILHGGGNLLPDLIFAHEKPIAFLTIDDRAICFTGVWPTMDELRSFRPWNRK